MAVIDVAVPDIGDFSDIPVIEVLVKAGDAVAKDAPLITLESNKATREVPSPAAGIVAAVTAKVGDKMSKGSPILTLETTPLPSGEGPGVRVSEPALQLSGEGPGVRAPEPAAPSTAESPTPAA